MTTAIDSSVLLDFLVPNSIHGEASMEALRAASKQGRLIVCESVVAEISPSLRSSEDVKDLLGALNVDFVPSDLQVGLEAGRIYRQYLANKGGAKRVLPDFLIGAHALRFADVLLTRDRGYYRDYFAGLRLVEPA